MRPVVTDRLAWSLCRSVSLSVTIVSPAKTAEPIEMPFRLWTRVGPTKHVLDWGIHWRNLANPIEPPMFGGDAAFCQITLTSRFQLLELLCVFGMLRAFRHLITKQE